MLPGIYLLTLTAPHSGDLETDRVEMGAGVRRFLKYATALVDERGRPARKGKGGRPRWFSTYALTWEATTGDDGRGHMHAHLAVIASWIPYTAAQTRNQDEDGFDSLAEDRASDDGMPVGPRRPRRWVKRVKAAVAYGLHELWRSVMPGAQVLDVQAPRRGANDCASAGGYLAKYVTKGVDSAEFTGRKAGELLCAFRGRRKVTTSAHFWDDAASECGECHEHFRSVAVPESLQSLMPGAVLRAHAEMLGHKRDPVLRGPPQVHLRWAEVVAKARSGRRSSTVV